MKQYIVFLYLVTTIATVAILVVVYNYWKPLKSSGLKTEEGFEAEAKRAEAKPIGIPNIMNILRRTTGRLVDIDMWKKHMILKNMTPVEMARYHLKSQSKAEDAQAT